MSWRRWAILIGMLAAGYVLGHFNVCSTANAKSRVQWEYNCVRTHDRNESAHVQLTEIANAIGKKGFELVAAKADVGIWCFKRKR